MKPTAPAPPSYDLQGIMAAIARGLINEAIGNLKEYQEHLSEQDKVDLLQILQLQNYV